MLITIYGKELVLQDKYCALNNQKPLDIETPYINLYVRIAGYCNADCPFCIYKNGENTFSFNKLFDIIAYLKDKVEIRKVSFTGGEPTTSINLLNTAIRRTRNLLPSTFIVVNTNGFNLKELLIDELDSVALSRHHYNNKINDIIFNAKMIKADQIKSMPTDKLHLSCNLVKGRVDSIKEVENYLSFAKDVGASEVGFVSLMPVNKFSRENKVKVNFSKSRYITKYKTWKKENICRCANYLYINSKSVLKIYDRQVLKTDTCIGNTLLFDGRYLRHGFTKEIIF